MIRRDSAFRRRLVVYWFCKGGFMVVYETYIVRSAAPEVQTSVVSESQRS